MRRVRSRALPCLLALGFASACRYGFGIASDGALGDDDANVSGMPDAPQAPNRIFVTTQTFTGALGGRAGADQRCQDAATAAGLTGEFLAVLWTSGNTPPSTSFTGSRGWAALDGTPIADAPTDLDGASLNPLRITEAGVMSTNLYYWYGGPMGASGTCTDWSTTTTGASQPHAVHVHGTFDTDVYTNCDSANPLICAEHGRRAIVTQTIETGRLAFVTGAWTPTSGIGGADSFCQTAASQAGLSQQFRAFLATSGATAESRFSTTGLPWRRIDGPRLTDTAAELVGPSPIPIWKTFIGLTASGAHTAQRIYTGTTSNNCSDWSTTATNGAIGDSANAQRSFLTLFPSVGCTTVAGLICLEI